MNTTSTNIRSFNNDIVSTLPSGYGDSIHMETLLFETTLHWPPISSFCGLWWLSCPVSMHLHHRGVNLVWNLEVVNLGLKTGVVGPKVQQLEARSIWFRVLSTEFLFNNTQIILFLKSYHFGKCSPLIFLNIIGYNNISWRPHNHPTSPIPKSGGHDPSSPRIDIYASSCNAGL